MSSSVIKILLVEDNPEDTGLVIECLQNEFDTMPDLICIESPDKITDALVDESFDIVISDLSPPDSGGLETLFTIKKKYPDTPIIVLSGINDHLIGSEAIKNGAEDYLTKDELSTRSLIRAIRYALDRRMSTEKLLSSEKRIETLIEKNVDGIVVVSTEGVIRYINPAAEKLFGRTKGELLGQLFGYPLAGAEASELTLHSKGAGQRFVDMRIVQTVYDAEPVFLCSLRDMTDERRMSEALRKHTIELERLNVEKTEINAAKDKFLSIIAHDVKNSLNTVIGFSSLLTEVEQLSLTEIKDYADTINAAANNTHLLLMDILKWERMQQGRLKFTPRPTKLTEILQELFVLIAEPSEAKRISLQNNIPSDLVANVDENMIKALFRNLIVNALKFTHEDGVIEVSALALADKVQVSVADNGMGISPEKAEQLFSIGTDFIYRNQENDDGTGLGLILCKEFVEKHDGDIWVESTPEVGTRFLFTLPLASDQKQ